MNSKDNEKAIKILEKTRKSKNKKVKALPKTCKIPTKIPIKNLCWCIKVTFTDRK